jgi:hypothetical protein
MKMAKSAFAQALKSASTSWTASKAKHDEMFGGEQIPKGTYTAQLISAKGIVTKQAQKPAVSRNFLIMEGDFEGRSISDMMGINFNELSPVFLRRWIDQMGYPCPEELTDGLEDTLEAITKDSMMCKISVKPSGQYYNIDVLEVWSPDGDAAEGEGQGGEGEGEADGGEADAGEGEGEGGAEGDDPETLAALLEFASSQDLGDVTVDDSDTIDSLKEKLADFQWKPEELAEGEAEMLERVGLGDVIVKPAPKTVPKAAPKGKAAPAAPAKASTPAKAAPAKAAPAKAAPKPAPKKK